MDVKELTFKGESDPKLYACGKCGQVCSPKIYACRDDLAHAAARRAAEECCKPRFCECGVELESPWAACFPCRERKILAKATIIDRASYDGPVIAECTGEWGDGYSSDICGLVQSCHEAAEDVPAYCHPCTPNSLRIDPDSVLEHAVDDMHEAAADQIVDADDLVTFINSWNEKQTCVSYYEDRSRVIVLDQKRFEALMAPRATETIDTPQMRTTR